MFGLKKFLDAGARVKLTVSVVSAVLPFIVEDRDR